MGGGGGGGGVWRKTVNFSTFWWLAKLKKDLNLKMAGNNVRNKEILSIGEPRWGKQANIYK